MQDENLRELDKLTDEEKIQLLTLFDDDFFRIVARSNPGIVEEILNTVYKAVFPEEERISIRQVQTQDDMKMFPGKQSIEADLVALDTKGVKHIIEIENNKQRAGLRRARRALSTADVDTSHSGEKIDKLPDTNLIMICSDDIFKKGKPFYLLGLHNYTTGKRADDEVRIIYINGEYRDNDSIGRMMHDFNCTDSNEIFSDMFRKITSYLKTDKGGIKEMSAIFESIEARGLRKGIEEKQKEVAIDMLKEGLPMELIVRISKLSLEQVSKLKLSLNL